MSEENQTADETSSEVLPIFYEFGEAGATQDDDGQWYPTLTLFADKYANNAAVLLCPPIVFGCEHQALHYAVELADMMHVDLVDDDTFQIYRLDQSGTLKKEYVRIYHDESLLH